MQRHHLFNHAQYGPTADSTRGQGRVLGILKLQEEISTKDLSYLLGIRQQSLNELLNKLQNSGYVTRVLSEEDKRVMLVGFTEKGRNENKKEEPDFDNIFNCLNEEEQETFGVYLDRIITTLESQLGVEVDDNERVEWLRAARSRMGNEQFERLMAMRRGFFDPGFHGMRSGKMAHEQHNPNNRDPRFGGHNGFHYGWHRDKSPDDK
ncbi:MarR family winged helix-turn-helix transcriptional regulator [Cytobacillus sp. Hz8]|uniref:MarR family winged helix-turn-helix transcriptional regulator n=1 Tax=Cytobacillus sp. Hz8 TaxID=3347168 RepID=UPI0035E005D9